MTWFCLGRDFEPSVPKILRSQNETSSTCLRGRRFAVTHAAAMHTPMASSQYFPLVDGARYEYIFASGPRVSATAVMHTGQTWAGSTQLTSFHMTAICQPATPCVEDTTDFFRMDVDGMHYFGGDGRTATHVNYMTTLMSPEWLLKNPVAPGTMMGPGMAYQDTDGWQVTVNGMHSVMGEQHHMSRIRHWPSKR